MQQNVHSHPYWMSSYWCSLFGAPSQRRPSSKLCPILNQPGQEEENPELAVDVKIQCVVAQLRRCWEAALLQMVTANIRRWGLRWSTTLHSCSLQNILDHVWPKKPRAEETWQTEALKVERLQWKHGNNGCFHENKQQSKDEGKIWHVFCGYISRLPLVPLNTFHFSNSEWL